MNISIGNTLNIDKKLVMCGCHEAGYHLISRLLENGIKFSYFVLIDSQIAQKNSISGYISFKPLAEKYNIPCYYVKSYSLKNTDDLEFFKQQKFDLIIQGGWQRLFPEEILNTLSIGAIGVHGSSEFLPKGRGRSPINWSLIEGKQRFIMHFFLIKSGVDDGDIFHFEMFDINSWDDCRTLYYKNAIITTKVLIEYIPKLLKNDYKLYPQIGDPTYYPKRNPEDGLIDWNKSIFEIYNFVRAQTKPYPGAFSYLNGEIIKIWKVQPFDTRITYSGIQYGEIIEVFDTDNVFVVNCNSGLLLVTDYDCSIKLKKGLIFTTN